MHDVFSVIEIHFSVLIYFFRRQVVYNFDGKGYNVWTDSIFEIMRFMTLFRYISTVPAEAEASPILCLLGVIYTLSVLDQLP